MDSDDDAHPVAMGSGLLLGMALGLIITAGEPAWQEAVDDLCALGMLEAGQAAEAECAPAAAFIVLPDPVLVGERPE